MYMNRRCFLLLLGLLPAALQGAQTGLWIRVDPRTLTLTLMQDDRPRRVFENISIGRYGATRDKRLHDNRTPIGRYRITHITADTPYHLFIGIDYPNRGDAERGLAAGLIDRKTYRAIINAQEAGRPPPQHTRLGGYLGIHGLGQGDPRIHADFNWTEGCIALTNEQIDELARWVKPGMPVVIINAPAD